MLPFTPELDIVVWACRAPGASTASHIARRIFEEAARRDLHLALAELPMAFFAAAAPGMKADQPTVICLRSVLMKPEHRTWMDAIWAKLGEATDAVAR